MIFPNEDILKHHIKLIQTKNIKQTKMKKGALRQSLRIPRAAAAVPYYSSSLQLHSTCILEWNPELS